MKAALATLVVILSSLAASAQTTTTISTQQVSLVLNVPCANKGKGETIAFAGKVRTIFSSTIANSVDNGFFMYEGALIGKGQTTGKWYEAHGTNDQELIGVTGFSDPINEDGTFTQTVDLRIREKAGRPAEFLFHQFQSFTISNNGNNLTEQPTVNVCK